MIGRGSSRVTSVTERSSPHRQSLPRCRGQTPIVPSPSSSTSTTVPLAARHGPPRVSRKCALPDHHVRHQVDVQPGASHARCCARNGTQDRPTSLQAKNVVFNVSEMEAKVRDATNDEPWYVYLPLCEWGKCSVAQGGELDVDARDCGRVCQLFPSLCVHLLNDMVPCRTFNL